MVKRLFFLVLMSLVIAFVSAQEVKEITLVVNGEGATKESATQIALRSAIEQAFGTFVSANTQILNDELVKDEIATISSGNIQKYTELGSATLQNGNVSVTLQATVSVNKLVQYAQSKGSECEFAGATLGANLKMLQLKYENSLKAYENLISYIRLAGRDAFDCDLVLEEPKISEGNASLVAYLNFKPNQNTESFYNQIMSTLEAISFTLQEKEILESISKEKYQFMKPLHPTMYYNGYNKYNSPIPDVILIPGFNELSKKYSPELWRAISSACVIGNLFDNNGDTVDYHVHASPNTRIQYSSRQQVAVSIIFHMYDYYKNYKPNHSGIKSSQWFNGTNYINGKEYYYARSESELADFNRRNDSHCVNQMASGCYSQTPIRSLEIEMIFPVEKLIAISKITVNK